MGDYRDRIDGETWTFIERSNSFYPPEAAGWSLERNRAAYDAMCSAFDAGYPANVTASTIAMEGKGGALPLRIYQRAEPDETATIVYLHGGGFVLGGLESHDSICAELCAGTGYRLVAVDYRLSPEHLHPAAFDDAVAAFAWAAREFGRPVVMVGDSAGANLAAAVSHATRGNAIRPRGQVLVYPGLGGDISTGSYVEHAHAPMLTLEDIRVFEGIRTGGIKVADDATLWPLADTDFCGLPPTFAVAAEIDPLSSDAQAYCSRIVAAGGPASWRVEEGLVHGYLRARHGVERAAASFARIVEATYALGQDRLYA